MRTAPLPFRSARAVPTEGLPPASDGVPKRSCAPQGFQRSVTEAMYDYFYGAEAEQFFFYRIPKVLFTEERFRSVSAEAKVLYGLLLDRMSLSCKNGWLDKEGRVYIIFTIEEVMTALGCADQKAGKLLHELESKCRLIERKRQGLGKPNLIYVMNVTINIYGDVHIHCDCCDGCGEFADDLEESPEVPYEDAPDTEDDSEEIELSIAEVEAVVKAVAELLFPFLPAEIDEGGGAHEGI